MGQLCCFPFSQAEEKISKLSPALVRACACVSVCVVGESSGIDLLAGGVCSRGRHSARARSSACRFVSASVIVRDLQTQAESRSAAVHVSVLSCNMNITVYRRPESTRASVTKLWPVVQILESQLLVFITDVLMILIDIAATVAYVVAFRKFPIWVSCETFPWNNAHKSGMQKSWHRLNQCIWLFS